MTDIDNEAAAMLDRAIAIVAARFEHPDQGLVSEVFVMLRANRRQRETKAARKQDLEAR